ALPGQPDPLPVGDARWDPDVDGAGAVLDTVAVAVHARVVDDGPGAAAFVAWFAETERTLVPAHHTAAVADRAHPRAGTRFRTAAVAGGARRRTGQVQWNRHSARGFAEPEGCLGLHIRTPARPAGAGAAAVEQPTEQVAQAAVGAAGLLPEDIAQVEPPGETATAARGETTAPAVPAAREQAAGFVVFGAFGRIREHGVGLADGLEPFLGLGVPRIGVRVQITGEFAVRLLDLLGGGVGGDAQFLVEVLFDPLPLAHRASPPFPIAARSRAAGSLIRRTGIRIRCLRCCGFGRGSGIGGGVGRGITHAVGHSDHRVPQHPLAEAVTLTHHHADHRIVPGAFVLYGLVQIRVEGIALGPEFLESLFT